MMGFLGFWLLVVGVVGIMGFWEMGPRSLPMDILLMFVIVWFRSNSTEQGREQERKIQVTGYGLWIKLLKRQNDTMRIKASDTTSPSILVQHILIFFEILEIKR